MNTQAGKLEFHPLTSDDVERILRRQLLPGEKWADGYPTAVQLDYLEAFLVEARSVRAKHHWQRQLRRRSDGLVIGGAGVTGPADETGAVVIGYELAGGLSDAEYGPEIVQVLIEVARDMGAKRVKTDLFDSDQDRRHVYFGAGLAELRREGRVVHLGRKI